MKQLIFLISIIFLSNTAQAQSFDALEKLLDSELRETDPGGILLIKKGDTVLFQKAIGIADIEMKVPISENTIFNTGSISKTFVANGILILESEEKLSLDDPIIKYFPNFKNPKLVSKVKIKHLLSHSSGLPDVREVGSNPDFYLTARDKENFQPLLGLKRLNFEPGSRFEYSNPAFNALALIIEKLTQKPWQDFIRKRIFEPSKMSQSRITNGPEPKNGVAHGYIKTDNGFEENDYGEFPTFAAAGNGGIWCSIGDLVKYEEAIQRAVFLEHDLIAKSRSIYLPENWDSDSPPKIGYSWFISEKGNNGLNKKIVSHTGSQGGFRSFYIAIPDEEIIFIALFNRPISNMNQIIQTGYDILKSENLIDLSD